MKKLKYLFCLFTFIFIFSAGCAPSSPKQVTEKFLNAYVKGDIDTMVEFLDSPSAQLVEGIYGLAGGFIGIDASTLISLSPALMSIMDSQDLYSIDYKIENEVVNGENATVDVTITISSNGASESQRISLPCVKIEGKWYVSLLSNLTNDIDSSSESISTDIDFSSESTSNDIDRSTESISKDVDLKELDINEIEIIPIYANYLELEPNDNYHSSIYGKEGWKLVIIEAAISNLSSNCMDISALCDGQYLNQSMFVTHGKYEYPCVYSSSTVTWLPPQCTFFNYMYTQSNTTKIENFAFVFQVPSEFDDYSFKFGNQKSIDLINMLKQDASNFSYVDEHFRSYEKYNFSSAEGAILLHDSDVIMKIEEINSSSLGMHLILSLENIGGNDISFSSDTVDVAIVDSQGVLAELFPSQWSIDIAPGFVKQISYSLDSTPDNYIADPRFVYVLLDNKTLQTYRIKEASSLANLQDPKSLQEEKEQELQQSITVLSADYIEDYFIFGDVVQYYASRPDFEIAGIFDNQMIVYDSWIKNWVGETWELALQDSEGNRRLVSEIPGGATALNYIGTTGTFYLMWDNYSSIDVTRYNLANGNQKSINIVCSALPEYSRGRVLADEENIYLVNSEGVTTVNFQTEEISKADAPTTESDYGSYSYSFGGATYGCKDYLIFPSGFAPWFLYEKSTKQLYPLSIFDEIDGDILFVDNKMYYISNISDTPQIVQFDLDTNTRKILYSQKKLNESYYYGILSPLQIVNGYIYFCYKEPDETYSIRKISILD